MPADFLTNVALVSLRGGVPILDRQTFATAYDEELAIAGLVACTPSVEAVARDLRARMQQAIAKIRDIGVEAEVRASNGEMVSNVRRELVGGAIAHAWRLQYIAWQEDEPGFPVIQAPDFTLERRAGDCKDHAALGAALLACLDIASAIVPMGRTPDDPAHVTLAILSGAAHAQPLVLPWQSYDAATPANVLAWSETTIAARFIEHPLDAVRRLGLD